VGLEDFSTPSVAVDAAVLTLDESGRELQVLLVRRDEKPEWALPGTFLHEGEVLADAVTRVLTIKAGVDGVKPRQLRVFDAIGRDDRGWVLSVAHVAVVRRERLAARFETTVLRPVARIRARDMAWDHPAIIEAAVADLRARYEKAADPDGLLGETFTMRGLLHAHTAVAGRELQRDNFRRAMREHVEPTGEFTEAGRGRPAELFRRR
jgi:8-oxo-dGTP diphosphatase